MKAPHMSIQHHRFNTGGYVLHKITSYWKGQVSAWFDADGKLTSADHIVPLNSIMANYRVRDVKKNTPMWREIQKIGLRYKNTQNAEFSVAHMT